MLGAATLWSFAGMATRHLEGAKGFEICFWRSLFAALFMIAVIVRRDGGKRLVRSLVSAGPLGLASGCMWGTTFVCYVLAMTMTTVANVLIVTSLAPLLTALLAWLVFSQPIVSRTWSAIAVAFIGMLWMFVGSNAIAGGMPVPALMVAFAIPLSLAVNYVLMSRFGQQIDLIPAVLIGALLSAAAMLPCAWPFLATPHDILILALLGMFQLALLCMMVVTATKSLSAPAISLLGLLEVLLGPFWAWLGAGKVPAQATLVDGVVVLAALASNEIAAMRTT